MGVHGTAIHMFIIFQPVRLLLSMTAIVLSFIFFFRIGKDNMRSQYYVYTMIKSQLVKAKP